MKVFIIAPYFALLALFIVSKLLAALRTRHVQDGHFRVPAAIAVVAIGVPALRILTFNVAHNRIRGFRSHHLMEKPCKDLQFGV